MHPRAAFLLLTALTVVGARAWPERFRFQYQDGEKYRLLTEVQEKVYVDGRLSHRAEILNKIAVSTLEVRDGAGRLDCTFQTSERAVGTDNSFAFTEDYQSLFWRDARGRYEIGPQYFMPVVRGVPLFPEKEVSPGDSWSAPGEEAHDLRRSYGLSSPVRFPIQVQYTYVGPEEREGRKLERIGIRYTVFHRLESLGLRSTDRPAPVRITGESEQTFWWDSLRGQPDSYAETFDFLFYLSNGQVVEYVGEAQGRFVESQPLDRAKVTAEIQRELADRGVPDTTVRSEEQGVTLSLQNIQFQPNSSILMPSEQAKLRSIAAILAKYADRDLLVGGHTARVGGYTDTQHQELSEMRAGAVADFLLSLGVIREEQVTTRGFGYSRPLGDNATEQGRSINRRVEITILEN